jgi:hypothetical protein
MTPNRILITERENFPTGKRLTFWKQLLKENNRKDPLVRGTRAVVTSSHAKACRLHNVGTLSLTSNMDRVLSVRKQRMFAGIRLPRIQNI